MNVTGTKNQLDPASFDSLEAFWSFTAANPQEVAHLTAAQVVELAMIIETKTNKREKNGSETANNNGRNREKNGSLAPQGYKVGNKRPPVEHQFKKGNPGGPGRPKGPGTMRSHIRRALAAGQPFDYPTQIAKSLLIEAVGGNTQAIRLVCENTNNRTRKR